MSSTMGKQSITRRRALKCMVAGVAGVAAGSRGGLGADRPATRAASRPSATGPVRWERQATGAEIWQVTSEEFHQSNIYCEVPYCSGDGRYFVYERADPKLDSNRTELMVVELGTWQQHRLDTAASISGCAISPDGVFYYLKRTAGDELELMRADLSKGTPEKVYRFRPGMLSGTLGTVSVDGRYYARGVRLDDQYKMFGILLVDLQKGTEAIIDRDPCIFNAHPQFEPGPSQLLMIQHNRGGAYSPDGKRLRLVGPEGATLYLLSVPAGQRTELKVGKPHTTPATGHEAWIGQTGAILLSVSAHDDYAPEKGNLLRVRAHEPASVAARGYSFNHVGVSRCGRFFCCDDWRGTCKVVIGSLRTGRTAVVGESRTSMGPAQNTHPHAYLTPDLKWVIFNSDRSGFPHIHAARVPEGMIDEL